MTRFLSQTELAKSLGISRGAVNNAVRRGQLVADPKTRKVDLHNHKTLEYMKKVAQRKGESPPDEPPAPTNIHLPPVDPPQVPEGTDGVPELGNMDLHQLFAMDRQTVDKLKVVEAIETTRLKNEQLRGKLIDRDLVKVVLGKIHTVDVQEILAIPPKFAATAAGLAGNTDEKVISSIEKELEKELYRCLSHIKRIIDDFLDKHEVEGE